MSTTKVSTSPIPYSFIPSESEQDNPNKLFLGGVAADTTEKQLEEFFSQFGKVKDVRIVTDRITAACKGYGFVTFEDDQDVDHLVEKKTLRMNGAKLRIRKAIRRNASQFEHVSPSKKWLVMPPSNMAPAQQSTGFLTPPNTPPASALEHRNTLYEKDMNLPIHVLLNGAPSQHQTYPVIFPSRARTNSLPPTSIGLGMGAIHHPQQHMPPSQMSIPEGGERFYFSPQQHDHHHQAQTLYHSQQQPQHHGRGRTYSMPITLQDYETLHLQKIHQEESNKMAQTMLVPANLNPVAQPKMYTPATPSPSPTYNAHGNSFIIPCYPAPVPPQASDNMVYCLQQPTTTISYHSGPPQAVPCSLPNQVPLN